MRRFGWVLAVGSAVALAGACGGSAFTAGGGTDGGGDATSIPDEGAGDNTVIVVDSSSGASSGGEASSGGSEASSDANEASSSDANEASSDANEASSGGGEASTGEAGGSDASTDAGPDVVEESPTTCGGALACVPAVPAGWSGPLELYAGSSAAPSCTTNFASVYSGNDQLSAGSTSCGCSCNPAIPQCGPPALQFDQGLCAPCATLNPPPGTCTPSSSVSCGDAGVLHSALDLTLSAPTSTSNTCLPQPSQQIPVPTWGTNAAACSATTAVAQLDCPAGDVCAPTPAAPYGTTLCVSRVGNFSCPSAGYTVNHVYYGGWDDTRGCSSCTCGASTGESCAATVTSYDSTDGSCSGGTAQTYEAPVSCSAIGQTDLRLTMTSTNGTCQPSQSTPTGGLTPSSPTTFCCMP